MQPFINYPFIININPHLHVTPSHIITLTLPTLKPSISLIQSHFFFFSPIFHHENPQNHLKQEVEQQNTQNHSTETSQSSPSFTINHSCTIYLQKEPQNSDTPSLSTMHAGNKRLNDTPKVTHYPNQQREPSK